MHILSCSKIFFFPLANNCRSGTKQNNRQKLPLDLSPPSIWASYTAEMTHWMLRNLHKSLTDRNGALPSHCSAFTTLRGLQCSPFEWRLVNHGKPIHHRQYTNDHLLEWHSLGERRHTAPQTHTSNTSMNKNTHIQIENTHIHSCTQLIQRWCPDCRSHQGPVKHYPLCDSSHSRNSLCNVFLPPPSLLHNSALNNTLHFCWHK